jgi:hypothetical protein
MIHPCCTRGGPIEYHAAKYYAQKCLELIGNPDDSTDTAAAARWRDLDAQVLRVRRGEITAHEVFASPQHDNWVFMTYYTYFIACRQFLAAIEFWRDVTDGARNWSLICKMRGWIRWGNWLRIVNRLRISWIVWMRSVT